MSISKVNKLMKRFSSYEKIPFHIIKLMNAMFIFSDGILSEYSFQTIFKDKYNLSYSTKKILDFLHTFKDVYRVIEGEDVPFDEPFISFYDTDLKRKLFVALQEEVPEAIELIFLDYSQFKFDPSQYNIFFELRCKALVALNNNLLYQVLLTRDELFLGNYKGNVRFKIGNEYKERYIELDVLLAGLTKYIEEGNSYLPKAIGLIDLADEKGIYPVSKFIVESVLKVMNDLDLHVDCESLLTYLSNYLINKGYLINSHNEDELLLLINLYESLLEERILKNEEIDVLDKAYSLLLSVKADVDYKFLINMAKSYLKINKPKAEKIIAEHFTFNSREELIHFTITNHLIHYLGELEKVAKILQA